MYWGRRVEAERKAWNVGVKFRLICRAANDLMSRRTMGSFMLVGRSLPRYSPSSLDQRPTFYPGSLDGNLPCTRLKEFSLHRCSQAALRLLKRHSQSLQSFFIEVGGAPSELEQPRPLSSFKIHSSTFPMLTTFTFRTNAASEWLKFEDLAQLLRHSRQLKHLTIFQLAGAAASDEASQRVNTEGEPACQLESLHIRRVRWIGYKHLSFIVAKSHHTLKQLTWVFERPATLSVSNPWLERGVFDVNNILHAFRQCSQIQTLRVADLVWDGSRPAISPLGSILYRLASCFSNLRHLETCGNIPTPELYDRHQESCPFYLRSLFIDQHENFRLADLMYQLRRKPEGPLKKLKILRIHTDILAEVMDEEWNYFQRILASKKVKLEVHREDPPGNCELESADLTGHLARLDYLRTCSQSFSLSILDHFAIYSHLTCSISTTTTA
ncbi:hypothetical protein Pst134EB_018252 [Puccinia striiformis f. sp. tritici]|nr:hypothetical protein Pst134EB_018252 [Puccinia striiformis f. sp. tritici]